MKLAIRSTGAHPWRRAHNLLAVRDYFRFARHSAGTPKSGQLGAQDHSVSASAIYYQLVPADETVRPTFDAIRN